MLMGAQLGKKFARMAGALIRSVAQGVLGVAVIQAVLAGIGLLAIGVPYTGLWTLLVLVLAIIQLPNHHPGPNHYLCLHHHKHRARRHFHDLESAGRSQ